MIRFGSLADIPTSQRDVALPPKADIRDRGINTVARWPMVQLIRKLKA